LKTNLVEQKTSFTNISYEFLSRTYEKRVKII